MIKVSRLQIRTTDVCVVVSVSLSSATRKKKNVVVWFQAAWWRNDKDISPVYVCLFPEKKMKLEISYAMTSDSGSVGMIVLFFFISNQP